MPFWRMFFNTVLYAGCVTAGQVFFCSLAGYAFARLQFRGRDTLFVLYLGTLMVPLTVTVIPQFILMRTVGWVDTPWAMIVPGLFGSAFGTYLMRQFFRTLPTDLEEAAILDGCSPWQIYWRILLPHARPAVMVLAVLTWVNVWNDFLWPLLMLQRNSLATLTLGLVRLRGEYVARWPMHHGDLDADHAAAGPHLRDRAAFVCPRYRRHRTRRVAHGLGDFRASDAAASRAPTGRPWIASTSSSATASSSFWSDRRDAARRHRCGWWPGWKRWIPDVSGSATATSPTSIPRIATSRWSFRTTLSTRT